MRPVLIDLGFLRIHAYGVFMVLAAVAGWWVLRAELRRRGEDGEQAGILVLAAVLGGFIGARLYYAVEHLGDAPLRTLADGTGFTWYGGAFGGTLAVLAVARLRRIAPGALLAGAALALALSYAIGRIGCQLAGDGTYGVASDLPWAMAYPDGEVPTTVRVHPTPVYETLAGLATFAALVRLRDALSAVRLFGLYLVLAGTARFLVEFLRRNDEVVAGLSQPQLVSAALVAGGVVLLARPAGARLRVGGA